MNTNFKINNYRKKRYDSGVLLTTDTGQWTFLTNDEYKNFKFNKINQDLYKKLEKNHIVINESNEREVEKEFRRYYWHLLTGTSLHIIVPTLRCNFTCKYCYAIRAPPDKKEFDMDKETAKKVVDFIYQSPAKVIHIEFTGGEPLLNFDVIKFIIEYSEKLRKVAKKEVGYSIITNGVLFNDKIVRYLMKNKVGVCISLDGPKELHDKHRKYFGGGGTYDDVVNWIKKLKYEYGYEKHTHAIPVITKFTFPHWKELVDEYVKLGFKNLRLKYASCFGFAKNAWDLVGYSPKEFLDMWKKCFDYMLKLNKKGIKIRDELSSIILNKILLKKNKGYAELQIPCGAAIGQLVYDQKGDIYTCDEARIFEEFLIGNVKMDSYKKVLSSNKVLSLVNVSSNLSLLCDACPWFSFCGLCPVHNFSVDGTLISKLPCDMRCQMHKEMINHIFSIIILDKEKKGLLEKWLEYDDK